MTPVKAAYRALSGRPGGGLWPGEGRRAAPDADGHGHHRRQGPEEAGPAARAGRERGDQRLLHPRPRHGGRQGAGLAAACSRTRPTTTPPRSSPSAARPPASAAASGTRCPAACYVHQAMRVTGGGDPRVPLLPDPGGQAAPAEAGHHRRRGLLLLRQPDRPGHRPRGARCITRATSPSAWSAAQWWALPPLKTWSGSAPPPATWSSCWAAARAATASAAPPAPPRATTRNP